MEDNTDISDHLAASAKGEMGQMVREESQAGTLRLTQELCLHHNQPASPATKLVLGKAGRQSHRARGPLLIDQDALRGIGLGFRIRQTWNYIQIHLFLSRSP